MTGEMGGVKHILWLFSFLAVTACSGAPQRLGVAADGQGNRNPSLKTSRHKYPTNQQTDTTLSQPVRTINRTPEVFEFEAAGEGSSSKYEAPVEAEKRAEEDALSRVAAESGINVYSSFQDVSAQYSGKSYQFIGKYLNIWTSNLVEYAKTGPATCELSGELYKCRVNIKGRVHFKGDPDPNFELSAALDKPAYFAGDDMELGVTLTKDAYISILNCDEEGNISLVYPNRYSRENFLPAGKRLNIPSDVPFKLKAMLPQGRKDATEILHVLATKKQPLFLPDGLKEQKDSIFSVFPAGKLADLSRKLSALDRADWATSVIVYSIKARD